jgi:hypothetical protein
MDQIIDESFSSILSIDFFDYYYKFNKYQNQNEYTPEFDNFTWDIFHRLNYNYLVGKKKIVVESVDVEVLKIAFPTIESFTGNLVFQSYKGNYSTPNNKILETIIKSCPKLKYMEIHNLNPIKNEDKLVINLDLLLSSSLENFIIKSLVKITQNKLVIEFSFNQKTNKKINIKLNVDNDLLKLLSDKYNNFGVFFI